MLTEKQRLDYICSHSDNCPVCGTFDTSGAEWDCDGETVWQYRTCMDCACEFTITWSLSDVQLQPGNEPFPSSGNLATACALRHALDKLLNIFDQLAAEGADDYGDTDEVKLARATLAQGFPPVEA